MWPPAQNECVAFWAIKKKKSSLIKRVSWTEAVRAPSCLRVCVFVHVCFPNECLARTLKRTGIRLIFHRVQLLLSLKPKTIMRLSGELICPPAPRPLLSPSSLARSGLSFTPPTVIRRTSCVFVSNWAHTLAKRCCVFHTRLVKSSLWLWSNNLMFKWRKQTEVMMNLLFILTLTK